MRTTVEVDVDIDVEFEHVEEFIRFANKSEIADIKRLLSNGEDALRDDVSFITIYKRTIMDELATPLLQELINRFGAEEILTRIQKSS